MPGEARMVPRADVRTYYDRPVLKAPTWKAYIPAYFFLGGMAGASSLIAAAADATGDRPLARTSRVVALAGIATGAACLVADLGRPARFHHMLRVAKPSSPMSVGTWILTAYGPAAGVAALTDLTGVLPRTRRIATFGAAALAPFVSTYTAVLLADTAVPVWHDARADLPRVFAAGSIASAAGAALVSGAVLGHEPPPAVVALAAGGAMAGVAAMEAMHHDLDPQVSIAYSGGRPAVLRWAAAALNVGGAAVVTLGRRRRWPAAAGGVMVAAASACERFAIATAGSRSARDPAATAGPQRARLSAS